MAIEPLTPDELRPGCDPDSLDFDTTAQADESTGILGQDRAVEALTFGMGMRSEGYNLFALGPSGVGKLSLIRQYAAQQAVQEPVPAEWCYVNNFDDYRKPRALQLPAGRGTALAADMSQLVNELGRALPALFESEEYRTRSESIEEGLNEQQQKAMRELQEKHRPRISCSSERPPASPWRRCGTGKHSGPRSSRTAGGRTKEDPGRHRGAAGGNATHVPPGAGLAEGEPGEAR